MDAEKEPAIYAQIGDFPFYEFVRASELAEIGEGAEALALVSNYRQNVKRIKAADLPDHTKHDMIVVAEQAMVMRFVEMGVPNHLAFHLFSLGKSCADDRDPAGFTRPPPVA